MGDGEGAREVEQIGACLPAARAASSSARLNQRASSSSVVSMVSAVSSACEVQPIISWLGKGHGWLAM